MLFIITGSERLLMDQRLEALKKEYPMTMEELNYIRLDCCEHSCRDLIAELTSVPFFSEYRMVVLTHPYFLTTEKGRNEKSEDLDALVQTLMNTDGATIAVIFAEGKLDERRQAVKKLKKVATNLTFDHLNGQQLKDACRQAFKRRQTSIDNQALDLLLQRAGDNLLHMQNEVDKLCLYAKKITIDDVRRLVVKPIEENAFELSNALLKRDLGRVLSIYRDLMAKNEEPIRLIAMIASSLRTLYQVKLLDRKGYNDKEIARYLDMNPFRLRYIRIDTPNFELDDILNLMAKLSHLDVQIKRGQIDKYQGLELFFMNLANERM